MPWLTILLIASATVTLMAGAAQLRLWKADPGSTERLFFVLACVGVVVTSLLEVQLLHVATPEEFQDVLRWMHLPAGISMVAFAWFTVSYLRAGPRWLAWIYTGARIAILVLNFGEPGNATFLEVTDVRQVPFLGETVAVAAGVESPLRILVRVSQILFVILIFTATVSAHRRGTRERPLVFGGAVLATILLFSLLSDAAVQARGPGPLPTLGFLVLLLLAYLELARDLARSVENERHLATARRRMIQATRAAGFTLWELTLDPDSVWTYGPGNTDGNGNPASATGLDDFLDTVDAADRDRIRSAILHAVGSGGDLDQVFRLAGSDARPRWIALAGSVDSGPRPGGRVLRGAMREITARKEAEAEVTAQREAMARAERAMTLGHLSAGLAHELQQPLGALLRDVDTAELLLERPGGDPDELRTVVGDLRAGVDRATGVIAHLHDFSTARPASFEHLAMGSLVEEAAALVRTEAVRSSIAVRVSVEPDLPPVHGDPILLQQVMVNLLMNAFDAVAARPPDLRTVSVRVASTGPGRQRVEVSDSGPGIPDEVAGRLFNPFFTTKPEGSGMGLWIARSIVERHGGRLELARPPSGGATFHFTLDSMEDRPGD